MKWAIIPSNRSDPEEEQHILDAIEKYRVTNWVFFRNSDGRISPWVPFIPREFTPKVCLELAQWLLVNYSLELMVCICFFKQNDTGSGSFIWQGLPPMKSDDFYYNLTVCFFYKVISQLKIFCDVFSQFFIISKFHWRRIPRPQSCIFGAEPEKPSTIQPHNIKVQNLNMSGDELYLELSWAPPEASFGHIVAYAVRISSEPPENSQRAFSEFVTQTVGMAL